MSKRGHQDKVGIRAFYQLEIVDADGTIAGRAEGYNTITNAGFLNMVNQMGTSLTGSKISYGALGTGTAPNVTDTTQLGELYTNGSSSVIRVALTAATSSTSKTLHNTGTFASGQTTAAATIQNIGLWQTSGPITSSGTLLQGASYTTSALATNQAVNFTYDLTFA